MSSIGVFPGLNDFKHRTLRGPINPLDKSTVVSIYPKEIIEKKPTIQPGIFQMRPGSFDRPSLMIVGPSSWWKEIDETQPRLEIPVSSIQVADSFVKDYCNGVLACNMADEMPGLFYVPGEHSVKQLKEQYLHEFQNALVRQTKFYQRLIMMADALWARSNGNPLAISDDMRLAAKQMSVEKDWMKDFQMVDMVRCFACGTLKNPQFPVCASCRAIDSSHPGSKDIRFAS